ncbi:MAG: dynamin family protein, partial [Planctomycetota bacterium]
MPTPDERNKVFESGEQQGQQGQPQGEGQQSEKPPRAMFGAEAEQQASAPMRTLLHQFSAEFDQKVRPLLDPIERATQSLSEAPDEIQAVGILPSLRDLRHQMQVLIDKVAEHQAYVLIFGPLKSGKSTFMNALCSAYVSEVTSLPAYPCIVNVSHSDEPLFVVTHYDGETEEVRNRDRLHDLVAQAHRDLTERIREVEADGQDFDPVVHMPSAIRKIDVKLPTPALAQSGAVLVDTPGLYTKMKFGYDRMTREFRNVAACAIFIVKTDNLFLEQVFQEFHELLELFSRVFLIVNIDSTKQDLRPDGTLGPSLERENPDEIVDAFRDLSMSAPLKQAADAGRLEIYPVDLLGAASRRIRQGRLGEDADHEPEGEHPGQQPHFARLMDDLTEYLNSNDYLRAFMVDSLRRAHSLLEELDELADGESVRDLGGQVQAMERAREETAHRAEAVRRLRETDWRQVGDALRQPMREQGAERSEQLRHSASQRLTGAIDEWFASDASLRKLNEDEIDPLLADARRQLVQSLTDDLRRRAQEQTGPADQEQVHEDLATAGIDLDLVIREALDSVRGEQAVADAHSNLVPRNIPVKRRVVDWLLLRRLRTVRR